MTRSWLSQEANRKIGEVLRASRTEKGQSLAEAAVAFGLSEDDLALIESRPAEIPCFKLYDFVQQLGPEASSRIKMAWLEIQGLGYEYRTRQHQ